MSWVLDRIESVVRCLITLLALTVLFLSGGAVDGADAIEPRKTVKGHLQTRPGGPLQEVDARVEPAPEELSILAAAHAELADEELVLGLVVDGSARAYPIRHLSASEVVGDRIGHVPVVATWCPLTGSAAAYVRRVDDRELTFDFVWGLLNDNLIITDRETGTVWSQLDGNALNGPLQNKTLARLPSVQTTWAFWKSRHPDTEVATVPNAEGRPYVYFNAGDENPVNGMRGTEHDLTALGLGLEVGPIAAFFPLSVLRESADPLRIDIAGTFVVIQHDEAGMTAWAEDGDGEPLAGVLAYQKAWSAFHPDTRVWGSQAGCGAR